MLSSVSGMWFSQYQDCDYLSIRIVIFSFPGLSFSQYQDCDFQHRVFFLNSEINNISEAIVHRVMCTRADTKERITLYYEIRYISPLTHQNTVVQKYQ